MSNPLKAISYDDLLDVYRQLADARNTNRASGGFLTTFADALLRADFDNCQILLPAAAAFVIKYRLLDKYPPSSPTNKGEDEPRP